MNFVNVVLSRIIVMCKLCIDWCEDHIIETQSLNTK